MKEREARENYNYPLLHETTILLLQHTIVLVLLQFLIRERERGVSQSGSSSWSPSLSLSFNSNRRAVVNLLNFFDPENWFLSDGEINCNWCSWNSLLRGRSSVLGQWVGQMSICYIEWCWVDDRWCRGSICGPVWMRRERVVGGKGWLYIFSCRKKDVDYAKSLTSWWWWWWVE